MKKIVLIFSMVLLLAGAAGAYNMSTVIAYPVPINPRQGEILTLNIPANYRIVLSVYDINGDQVFKRTYNPTVTTITWNCRNGRGSIVKPGLYIIKVVVEDESTGDYGKKIIRILVKG